MTLRKKLTCNLFFLFAIIVALAVVGSYYLSLLASVSTEVTTNNYRTLNYVQGMTRALTRIDYALETASVTPGSPSHLRKNFDSLEAYLVLQEKNITEQGEQALTQELRDRIEQFRSLVVSPDLDMTTAPVPTESNADRHPILLEIHEQLESIHQLNSEAVFRKNRQATKTAQDVILYMSIIGTVGIVIGWLFAITLPGIIFKPIHEFNKALGEITEGNYDLTLAANSNDEIGMLATTFNRMTVKLKEFERSNLASIVFEKQRLAAIINRVNEGVIGVDAFRQIIFANDFILRLLDMKREDVIGRYAPDVALHNMLFAEMMRRMETSGGEAGNESAGYLKIVVDNHERLFVQSVVNIQSEEEDENQLGQAILLSDITEFAEKDSAKTKLIGTLSHELKTPAAAIDMCADLMSNAQVGTLNDEQKGYLETIRSNTLRIRKLIADMIDLAKVESGAIDMRIEPVQPNMLIEKAVEGIRIFLDEKKIRTHVSIAEDLPSVAADINKAVWALNNLLTNAIRHSPPGSTITIDADRKGSNITITVADQGSGFPAKARDRLFDRYTRFDEDSAEGTGLGLAIVKEFMEGMGGSVEIESAVGRGSRFTLIFGAATFRPA